MSRKLRSRLASLGGLLVSLATAYAVIDFATFDIKKDWMKLIIVGLPAIGGFMSRIKDKEKKIEN